MLDLLTSQICTIIPIRVYLPVTFFLLAWTFQEHELMILEIWIDTGNVSSMANNSFLVTLKGTLFWIVLGFKIKSLSVDVFKTNSHCQCSQLLLEAIILSVHQGTQQVLALIFRYIRNQCTWNTIILAIPLSCLIKFLSMKMSAKNSVLLI